MKINEIMRRSKHGHGRFLTKTRVRAAARRYLKNHGYTVETMSDDEINAACRDELNKQVAIQDFNEGSLNEAPIGDIRFIGDTEPASFRRDDIGIVTGKKSQAKIKRVLEKAPVLIHLVFVNHPYGENFADSVRGKYTTTFQDVVDPDPNAVTVVFMFNEGDDRRPFTPWMIAHRIAHVLHEGDESRPLRPIIRAFNELTADDLPDDVIDYSTGVLDVDTLAFAVAPWKSSRDNAMGDIGEFVAESFAQFLVRGRIELNPVGEYVTMKSSRRSLIRYPKLAHLQERKLHIFKPEVINQRVERWSRLAEKMFTDLLNKSLGTIVVF